MSDVSYKKPGQSHFRKKGIKMKFSWSWLSTVLAIIIAGVLAYQGSDMWGWFLLFALLI